MPPIGLLSAVVSRIAPLDGYGATAPEPFRGSKCWISVLQAGNLTALATVTIPHAVGAAANLWPLDRYFPLALFSGISGAATTKFFPGKSLNPLTLWKEAWNDCGRPGSGLMQKVRDFATRVAPQPAAQPAVAPAPRPVCADALTPARARTNVLMSVGGSGGSSSATETSLLGWDTLSGALAWLKDQMPVRYKISTGDSRGSEDPTTVRAWVDQQGIAAIVVEHARHFVNNAAMSLWVWAAMPQDYPAGDELVVDGARQVASVFDLIERQSAEVQADFVRKYQATSREKLEDVARVLDVYLGQHPLPETSGDYVAKVRRWKGETAPPTAGSDPVPDTSAADGAKDGLIIGPTVGAGGELDPTVGQVDGQSKGFAAGDPVPMTSPLVFPADPVGVADASALPGYTIDPTLDVGGLLVFPITADADASIVLSAAVARPAVRIEAPAVPTPVSTPRPAGGEAEAEVDPEETESTPVRWIPDGRWLADPNLWPMMVAEPPIGAFNPMAAVSAGERFMNSARVVFDARYPIGSSVRFDIERAIFGRWVAASPGSGNILFRGTDSEPVVNRIPWRVTNARPNVTTAPRAPGGSGQRPAVGGGGAAATVLRGLGWAGALLGAPTFMESVRQDMVLQRFRDGEPIVDTTRTVDGSPIIIYPQY